jgi:hypothetical protein
MNPKDIATANRICEFLVKLSDQYRDRWEKVDGTIPHGDLAYGSALMDWYKNGRPKNAAFSYAEGQIECPFLMEFRKELSAEFGMPILTRFEAKLFDAFHKKVITVKVKDWLN